MTANWRRISVATGFVFLGWVCYATPLFLVGRALGVELPFALVLALVPLAGLATWFPLPGGLGGVEVALTAGLVVAGDLGVGTAAAVALLYRVCSYWVVVAVDGAAALSLSVLSR